MTTCKTFHHAASTIAIACCVIGTSYADDRTVAARELAPLFNSSYQISAQLESVMGPSEIGGLLNGTLFGCPEQSGLSDAVSYDTIISSGSAGPWAGSLDGINTPVTLTSGDRGTGLALPSNSTARLPDQNGKPALRFDFGLSGNVTRDLIDAAAEKFTECFSKLPPGSYTGEQLTALCPIETPTRAQQGQTCIPIVTGSLELSSVTGVFDVQINEGLMCDYVGFSKRSAERNTGFTSCFVNIYKGQGVKLDKLPTALTVARKARANAVKTCLLRVGSRKGVRRQRSVAKCVSGAMSRRMARFS